MLGYERAELIDKAIVDLLPPESREPVIRNIRHGASMPELLTVKREGISAEIKPAGSSAGPPHILLAEDSAVVGAP